MMDVNRGGKMVQVQVKLRERTDEAMAMFDGSLFGAKLVPVTAEVAKEYGYENLRGGLIVAGIKDDSPAAEVGLEVGDVLESAGGVLLRSVDQLSGIFAEAKKQGQRLQIIVRRGNERMILPLLVQ
jgi:serine protease Do